MFGLSRYEKRLKIVEEICEKLDRDAKKLDIEWTETYEKFRQLHMRIAKRVKDADRQQQEVAEREEQLTDGVDGVGESHPGFLTARQKKIQQQILQRRSGR